MATRRTQQQQQQQPQQVTTTVPVATVVNGHTFTVDSRYQLANSRILGKGSFGVVCTAYDTVRQVELAIKRIRPFANDDWDARHTLREIRLLKLLGPHPNIISLYELSLFEQKTELYMMMELMDCDLHRVIQSKQALSEKHHKCFLRQMLEGIRAMHAIGVFHRDLKPGNLLVSKDCQLRITDFGLARFMDEPTRQGQNDANPMTEYVVTRWYRCPELLLAPNRPYSEAIDLWSIGCIFAELLRRKPLFPGKSHTNQVQLIFEAVGYSSPRELGFPVSTEAVSFLDKRCRYRKQPIKKYVPDASSSAVQLLEQLLSVSPVRRPSAAQALEHVFLADAEVLNDYSQKYLQRPTLDFFEFEQAKFSVPRLKQLIEREVALSAADAYRHSSPARSVGSNRSSKSDELSPAQHLAAHGVVRSGGYNSTDRAVPQQLHQQYHQQQPQQQQQERSQHADNQQRPPMVRDVSGSIEGSGAAVEHSNIELSAARNADSDSVASDGPDSQQPTFRRALGNRALSARNGRLDKAVDSSGGSENPYRSAVARSNSGSGRHGVAAMRAVPEEENQIPIAAATTVLAQHLQVQALPQSQMRPKSSDYDSVSEQAAAYRTLLLSSRSAGQMGGDCNDEDGNDRKDVRGMSAAAAVMNNDENSNQGNRYPIYATSSSAATAAAASARGVSVAAAAANDPIPLHSIPQGNILAAVRNDAALAHVPSGSKMRTPKSPSPKKVDNIHQKDLNNKRRFLIQQEAAAASSKLHGFVNSNGSSSGSSSGSSRAMGMPRPAPRAGTTRGVAQLQQQQQHLQLMNSNHSGNYVLSSRTESSAAAYGEPTTAASGGGSRRFNRLMPQLPGAFPALSGRSGGAAISGNSQLVASNAVVARASRKQQVGISNYNSSGNIAAVNTEAAGLLASASSDPYDNSNQTAGGATRGNGAANSNGMSVYGSAAGAATAAAAAGVVAGGGNTNNGVSRSSAIMHSAGSNVISRGAAR